VPAACFPWQVEQFALKMVSPAWNSAGTGPLATVGLGGSEESQAARRLRPSRHIPICSVDVIVVFMESIPLILFIGLFSLSSMSRSFG